MKSMVWAVFLYGVEGWTLKKSDWNRIEAFEMWCWRKMLSISWQEHRTNDSILTELGLERELMIDSGRLVISYQLVIDSDKAIGHQWYWSYEYSDFPYISYDSFMLPTKLLKNGEFRLLEVDNRLIVPINTEIRLLVTASDVIHAWTIPALRIKADAIPGRLNQLTFTLRRTGVFYGQCSEICGANHSFIPIVLESETCQLDMSARPSPHLAG